jgi:cyclopropane fatty-acyl-phospholipid synthase-like methyltransferase
MPWNRWSPSHRNRWSSYAESAGCGRGSALIALADRFPGKRFVGYDLCEEAIGHADRAARATDLRNIRFEVRDLTGCGEAARFDLVTSFDACLSG